MTTEGKSELPRAAVARQVPSAAERVKAMLGVPAGMASFRTGYVDELLEREDGPAFLERIANDSGLMKEISENPDLLRQLVTYGPTVLDHPEMLQNLLFNSRLQTESALLEEAAFRQRLLTNPFATDEELSAGTYFELLETQVRDAVVALRRKGYDTFESGFDDMTQGSQYVGFRKGIPGNPPTLPAELVATLSEKGVAISLHTSEEDRDQYRLVPTGKPNLAEWKEIWNMVAASLPERTTPQATEEQLSAKREFREKQEAMRRGEVVYVGDGKWFQNGIIYDEDPREERA